MSVENRESIARHWLDLKQSWNTWREKGEMPSMNAAASAYFEQISGTYFRKWLTDLRLDQFGFAEVDNQEAWRISLTYLLVKRPKSSRYLLDDIFERAHRNASEKIGRTEGEELESFLNWVLSQFKMRMRDVVRYWVTEEKGSRGVIAQTTSTETPVGAESGDGETRTLGDFLGTDEEEVSELEREEFRSLAEKVSVVVFDDLDDAPRITIFLEALHRDFGIRISCADPRITNATGLQKAQLYARRKEALQQAVEMVRGTPAWRESDCVGRHCLECFAIEWMLDFSREWFHRKKPACLSFLITKSAEASSPAS